MKTAKEIANWQCDRNLMGYELAKELLIEKIINYAKQKVKERDGQWDNALAKLKYDFCQEDLIEIVESLPEPEFQ